MQRRKTFLLGIDLTYHLSFRPEYNEAFGQKKVNHIVLVHNTHSSLLN